MAISRGLDSYVSLKTRALLRAVSSQNGAVCHPTRHPTEYDNLHPATEALLSDLLSCLARRKKKKRDFIEFLLPKSVEIVGQQ